MRDKLNNLVLFDKATYEKLYKEVPNYKLITPAVVSERLKIRGSLARNALQELLGKGEFSFFFWSVKIHTSESNPFSTGLDTKRWCVRTLLLPFAFCQSIVCSGGWQFVTFSFLILHFTYYSDGN